ncbi:uncharacterized protein LOC117181334 [Belonocnema kinseyi]|uniref:uncharacterized protein LOC117181334 n=1 Tax=Belonocnema kinseyi TaxID=2817044 RepID=UPI00143D98B0|nr:uncharacterized protein LOC117181334 [Belonocnema kinseyi]
MFILSAEQIGSRVHLMPEQNDKVLDLATKNLRMTGVNNCSHIDMNNNYKEQMEMRNNEETTSLNPNEFKITENSIKNSNIIRLKNIESSDTGSSSNKLGDSLAFKYAFAVPEFRNKKNAQEFPPCVVRRLG